MSDLVGNPEDRFSHNEAQYLFFQRNEYGSEDISSETEETLPSLKLIKILKEMSRARTELDRVS